MSSTTASATSETTRSCRRRLSATGVPLPRARRRDSSDILRMSSNGPVDASTANSRPMTVAAAMTCGWKPAGDHCGSAIACIACTARERAILAGMETTAPASVRVISSAKSSLQSARSLAPRAARTAMERWRSRARKRNRLATLAQARSTRSNAPAATIQRARRTSGGAASSVSGTIATPMPFLVSPRSRCSVAAI